MGKILVVEDAKLQRLLLTTISKKLGHEVQEANDGFRGLELAKSFKPDLIIMDLVMPKMGGMEMLTELKKTSYSGGILVQTADIQQSIREEIKEIGVYGFIPKPTNRKDLEGYINGFFGDEKIVSKVTFYEVEPTEKDKVNAINEMINIGIGKASLSLNELINSKIFFSTPSTRIIPIKNLDEEIKENIGRDFHSVLMSFQGAFKGNTSLYFSPESGENLYKILKDYGEEETSGSDITIEDVISETGNIILTSVLSIISNTANKRIHTEPPEYKLTNDQFNKALLNCVENKQDELIFSLVEFRSENNSISGVVHFVINLNTHDETFNTIVNKFYAA